MEDVKTTPKAKTKTPKNKKKIIAICALVAGLVMLIVGVVMLVLNIIAASRAADGDYLVKAGDWALEGEDGVIWDFTEVGKGKLTTNNHQNDYNFIWAIEDGKLMIETDWLYRLDNTYEYSLDQGAGVLTLTADDATYKFTAQ